MRRIIFATICLCFLAFAIPSPNIVAQSANTFELKKKNETVESGDYKTWLRYYLAPGWAKPRRVLSGSRPGQQGVMSLGSRTGQPVQNGMPLNSNAKALDGFFIDAIVLPKAAEETRARVIVGVAIALVDSAGMAGGMDGYGSEGMGAGMSMGGMPGMSMGGMPGMSMGGYGGGMGMSGSMMGGGEDMGMGAGAGGMSMPKLAGAIQIIELEDTAYNGHSIIMSNVMSNRDTMILSTAQLKNLAELVRVDCWIEDELTNLRAVAREPDKSKQSENALKQLLGQEYQLQLTKQSEDIEKLSEKLKALQGELARRASAQERVVDVQLGQLILEAQGLIGERP